MQSTCVEQAESIKSDSIVSSSWEDVSRESQAAVTSANTTKTSPHGNCSNDNVDSGVGAAITCIFFVGICTVFHAGISSFDVS